MVLLTFTTIKTLNLTYNNVFTNVFLSNFAAQNGQMFGHAVKSPKQPICLD